MTGPARRRPPGARKPPRARALAWIKGVLIALSALVLAAAALGGYWWQRLDGNIHVDTATARELLRYEKERPKPAPHGATNILVLGSDTRRGHGNGRYGRDTGTQRSDTAILLHLAGDRKSVTAVSIPRDLMVPIPSCRRPNGEHSGAQENQFNFAYAYGGASCTIRVVEKLTRIRVDHHLIVDFKGFKEMVDAVDGVEVCLRKPVHDKAAKLDLSAGHHVLHGEQALGYVRARKALGGGSDTERMARQQEFMASLVHKVQSDGVLLNPLRLAPLLDAATKSLTADEGLSSLSDLYDLTRGLRGVPASDVHFLTVPRRPHRLDRDRDELVKPQAERLFRALRNDRAVPFVSASRGASGGAAHRSPGFTGTTPTDDICK